MITKKNIKKQAVLEYQEFLESDADFVCKQLIDLSLYIKAQAFVLEEIPGRNAVVEEILGIASLIQDSINEIDDIEKIRKMFSDNLANLNEIYEQAKFKKILNEENKIQFDEEKDYTSIDSNEPVVVVPAIIKFIEDILKEFDSITHFNYSMWSSQVLTEAYDNKLDPFEGYIQRKKYTNKEGIDGLIEDPDREFVLKVVESKKKKEHKKTKKGSN